MATTLVNNLYPPLVPDFIPAFVRTEPCRIYFSLSIYNNVDDIKNVQISLINQKTNQSALNPESYPSGIKIVKLRQDPRITNDYKYYVDIDPTNGDLVNDDNAFELNTLYIVQLRFTSVDSDDSYEIGSANWLNSNINYFSEWSKICLLRGISYPHIKINESLRDGSSTLLSDPLTSITGKLYYNEEEKEYLKSYNIKISTGEGSNSKIVFKSEQIYTNQYAPNEINYLIPYNFVRGTEYTLLLAFTTNNLYTRGDSFTFTISQQAIRILDVNAELIPEEENGRIRINMDFSPKFFVKTDNDLIIQRTSSRTDFTIWETLVTIPHNVESLKHFWYDNTIESGIWYKYRIQEKVSGMGGKIHDFDEPVICVFEDIFLTDNNRQLKIQFNPTVSEFRYNTMDSQQVTLGSKFPFVKRNGNNYFRSFSIGGLISSFSDSDNWYNPHFQNEKFHIIEKPSSFTSPYELYGNVNGLYEDYNSNNRINNYNDYIYEREFRQKVLDFLYENNIKLFRSLTEGNMLVKLMNITLQPVDSLGRRLYSFSATAIEMDDFTIANYLKYNNTKKSFYYNYGVYTLTDSFENEDSLIDKFFNLSEFSDYKEDSFKIAKLNISTDLNNVIVYVKTTGQTKYDRYIVKSNNLQITLATDEYIKDCYFYGIHLDEDGYTIKDEHYNSLNDITNPINYEVYKVLGDWATINNYLIYDPIEGLLTTVQEETYKKSASNYGLYAEEDYELYLYYNGVWYPLSEGGDLLMDVSATVQYYYEIKEEI